MTGSTWSLRTAFERLAGVWLLAGALGCSATPFPDCCSEEGERDVPYLTTYRFNFRTGSFDIVTPNPDRFLGILTQADVLTLMNAAGVTQSPTLGLVSGILSGPRGPLRETAIVVTDADGNAVTIANGPLRNFFYNSLGQVPDFVVSEGTTDQGSFTLFDAPPGELYLQLVAGGRGNGRIEAHSGAVSIGRFAGLEALPPTVGVLAIVQDAFTRQTVGNVVANFFGWRDKPSPTPSEECPDSGNPQLADANGLFVTARCQGLPTQSTGLLSLAARNYRTTLKRLDLSMGLVNNRQQAFDPLTLDNVFIYSESGLQAWAAEVGVSIPLSDPVQPTDSGIIVGRVRVPDGTGVTRSVVTPVDRDGQPLGARGRVFYLAFGGTVGGAVDPNLTQTDVGGGYVLFVENCAAIPGGIVYLNAGARTVTLPQSLNTSRASAPCIPGGVVVEDLVGQEFQSAGLFFTVSLQGRVNSVDGTAVPAAQVQFLGVPPPPQPNPPPPDPVYYVTSSSGVYQVLQGAQAAAITPLLGLSPYTARVSKSGYVTTYSDLVTGLNGGRQDLLLLPEALQQAACGASGRINVYGVVRDLGIADPSRQGLPAEGISLTILDERGLPPSQGHVVYYQSPSQERTGLDGVFAVCDLPPPPATLFPPLYQIRVTSQDDSGAMTFPVYGDGASVMTFVVNKAFPREVSTTGQVVTLLAPEGTNAVPVGGATLSVRGTKLTQATGTDGRLLATLPLPSNGRYLVRAEREGYLPTYNYQMVTPPRLRQVGDIYQWAPAKIAAKADLDREGIPWSAEDGLVAGKVVVPGFGARTDLVGGSPAPVAIFPGLFNSDDPYPDLLLVFSDHADFRFGDGAGSLYDDSGKHPPRLNVPLTIASGAPQITAAEPADFNVDGIPDFVAISGGKVYVFFGNSTGGFDPGQEIALPGEGGAEPVAAYAVNIVDADQDGRLDLLVATNGVNGGNPIARFLGKTGSQFVLRDGDPVGDACGSHRPRAVAPEFSEGLGMSAVIIADQDGTLCVYPMNANGSPLAVKTLTLLSPPLLMRPATLDSDEISDVLILHQEGFGVLLGVQNQATPLPPIEIDLPEGFTPNSMMIGDVNRDGRNDLLISGQAGILFYLGAGNGRFNAPTALSDLPTTELNSLGLDDDGRPDLVASDSNGLAQFRGADLALPGVELEARDESGQLIGTVRYLTDQGAVAAQSTATTSSGRFVIDSLPPGFVMVRVRAGGSGNALVTAYPGSLSYTELSANPLPGTIKMVGQTLDPLVTETSGTVAEGILVTPLGTGTQVRSSCCTGTSDPFTAAFELSMDANSEYILKLQP